MSTSYIAIFPKNPLLSNPKKIEVIHKLKEIGFIHEIDFEWLNPENGIEERYFRPGSTFLEYFNLFANAEINEQKLQNVLINYKEHDKIEAEFYAEGDFLIFNQQTGSILETSWSDELGEFLEDNNHKWTDPLDKKEYYFFELECTDLGLGKHFLTIEDGFGEPNIKLMELMKIITGNEYKWMWSKI